MNKTLKNNKDPIILSYINNNDIDNSFTSKENKKDANQITLSAIEEANNHHSLKEYQNIKDLFNDLEI